jgi:hypothetical protein
VVSTEDAKKADSAAASTSTQIAQYNANVDAADSAQIDEDTQQNIDNMRSDAATYMSRQQTAFVSSGVVGNTGSALAVRAATAGQFAMKEQQAWQDSQAKEETLASEAQAGIAEGAAQADQYDLEGQAAVLSGASKVAGQLYSYNQQGLFGSSSPNAGGVSPSTNNLSNQLF